MSVVKNRTQIYSGTDYLGTARDPEFLDKLSKALETDGLHYGGSRWANNCPSIYNVAERFLADFYGVEETLLFSSGSMAAYFTQKIILGAGEVFIMNDLHPAMRTILPYPKILPDEPERWQVALKGHSDEAILLFNVINPSTVDRFNTDWLKYLPVGRKFLLVFDDSHGIGMTGENEHSILSEIDLPENVECLVVASLGKSFGLPGGLIMGKRDRIETIKKLSQWGGASPPSPFVARLLKEEMEYFGERRKKMISNLELFKQNTDHLSLFKYIDDFPVFLVQKPGLYEKLLDHQIEISAFPYPDPGAPRIERIVVNAMKTSQSILHLTELINYYQ